MNTMQLECADCGLVPVRLNEMERSDGSIRIRARCTVCDRHIKFVNQKALKGLHVYELTGTQAKLFDMKAPETWQDEKS